MTTRTHLKISKASTVTVPLVPNFIKIDDTFRPLYTFEVHELQAIGDAWTKGLIAHAGEQAKRARIADPHGACCNLPQDSRATTAPGNQEEKQNE